MHEISDAAGSLAKLATELQMKCRDLNCNKYVFDDCEKAFQAFSQFFSEEKLSLIIKK